uniref:Uncharacterized protein n=1 Tax=Arundo donax TaxID=35708 RepID=A0A0A8YTI8_ARUDO
MPCSLQISRPQVIRLWLGPSSFETFFTFNDKGLLTSSAFPATVFKSKPTCLGAICKRTPALACWNWVLVQFLPLSPNTSASTTMNRG